MVRRLVTLSLALISAGCKMMAPHDSYVEPRRNLGLAKATSALTAEDRAYLRERSAFASKLATAMKLGADGQNVCVSTFSVDLALCMLANGSQGNTFDALAKCLSWKDARVDKFNLANSRILDLLASEPGAEVRVSNSIWNVIPVQFKKNYQADMEKHYAAQVKKLGSAGEGALKQVNDWAKYRSNGRITKIIDSLDKSTYTILVSMCTFDGTWPEPLTRKSDRVFIGISGARRTPFVSSDRLGESFTFPGGTGVRVPYADSTLSLNLLLPQAGSPPMTVLSAPALKAVLDRQSTDKCSFEFPIFNISSALDIRDPIRSLCGDTLFDAGEDFKPMSHAEISEAKISLMIHRTWIKVDENGTKAAAGTATVVKGGEVPSAPKKIVFDRPFAFVILEEETKVPLFLGVVNQP
ncbi:MAG: hypothetical protein JNM34_00825 [Chthonomonadaceae bacterium]|nr:hypothetical protein [Chthonomonadaceae bacterium]